MNSVYSIIKAYALSILVIGAVGCNKDDAPKDNSLRSDFNTYYTINNREATKRLASVMYNRADTLHPVERFKFVHISDPHLSGWSSGNYYAKPNNLVESVAFANQRELKINAMVETGDHISNSDVDTARLYLSSFFNFFYKDNYIPAFSCYGNHDPNIDDKKEYIPSDVLANAVRAHRNHPVGYEPESKSYYYADVPNPQGGTIRFIALDMLDQPGNEYNTLHYVVYSQEQIDWLGNVALREGMTAGHSVIVLTHFPFQASIWGGMGKAVETESYLCDGDFVNTWQMVPEIMEAYRTRSSICKTYRNKVHPDREGIKAEFDFTGSAGEFVCYLGGHAHCFALFDVHNTGSTLLPQKMILCTNQAPSEVGIRYSKVRRAENSVTSNSFNIYAVDTNEKKVYITFFGAYIPFDDPSFPAVLEFFYL
jgi:predicted MPP superfamily phosphohydrolase